MEAIDRFVGDYAFLSNFWMCPIKYQGITYRSVEHGYQALKATNDADFTKIWKCKTAGEAKRLGAKIKLREDWESVKMQIMYELILAKFKQNEQLWWLLIDTEDAQLIEGNTWGDRFWGVCDGLGHNYLGKLLMRVREVAIGSEA